MVKLLSLNRRLKKRTYFFHSLNDGKNPFHFRDWWGSHADQFWQVVSPNTMSFSRLYAVITDSFWNWCLGVLKLSFHLNHEITCSEREPLLTFYNDQKSEIHPLMKSGNLAFFFAFHWKTKAKNDLLKWARNNLTSHTLLSFKDNTIINFNWHIIWNTSRALTGSQKFQFSRHHLKFIHSSCESNKKKEMFLNFWTKKWICCASRLKWEPNSTWHTLKFNK